MQSLCDPVAAHPAFWSRWAVMTAASIGAGKAGGYARYLESKTLEPELGDYYLSPTGEPTQVPGRWLATPSWLVSEGNGHELTQLCGSRQRRRNLLKRGIRRAGSDSAEESRGACMGRACPVPVRDT